LSVGLGFTNLCFFSEVVSCNNKFQQTLRCVKKFLSVVANIVLCVAVPSQMVLAKTLNKQKNLMSVATKIAIQMNCKMGGVVWSVQIPVSVLA
jgi:hypothetical protein